MTTQLLLIDLRDDPSLGAHGSASARRGARRGGNDTQPASSASSAAVSSGSGASGRTGPAPQAGSLSTPGAVRPHASGRSRPPASGATSSSASTSSPARSRRTEVKGPSAAPQDAVAARGAADSAYWRLDDHTRALGLRGVEEARRALAAAVERTGFGTAA